jgi:hypothetical protein
MNNASALQVNCRAEAIQQIPELSNSKDDAVKQRMMCVVSMTGDVHALAS